MAKRLWVDNRYRRCCSPKRDLLSPSLGWQHSPHCCPCVQKQPPSLWISRFASLTCRSQCYSCLLAPYHRGSFPSLTGLYQVSHSVSVNSFCNGSITFWFIALASLSFRKPHVSRLGCNCYPAIGYQMPTDICTFRFYCTICASPKELLENSTFQQIYPSLYNI